MPVKLRHIMKHTLAGACAALFIFLDKLSMRALFKRRVLVRDQASQITASVAVSKVRRMQHSASRTNHWLQESFVIPTMSPK